MVDGRFGHCKGGRVGNLWEGSGGSGGSVGNGWEGGLGVGWVGWVFEWVEWVGEWMDGWVGNIFKSGCKDGLDGPGVPTVHDFMCE